jgi:hypothetical protein
MSRATGGPVISSNVAVPHGWNCESSPDFR